jgi:hypothetical protein
MADDFADFRTLIKLARGLLGGLAGALRAQGEL